MDLFLFIVYFTCFVLNLYVSFVVEGTNARLFALAAGFWGSGATIYLLKLLDVV